VRKTLHKFLSRANNENIYFLHADMWGFPTKGNVINCGIQEPNMVNVAAGLASQGKTVIIYGVAGFVLYKAYEQIKLNIKGWSENYGSIIFVNAGANGCYSFAGRGHLVDDDLHLTSALDIPLYEPKSRKEFLRLVKEKCKSKGVSFIRLGRDGEKWK
jgi:transketolase